MRYTKKIGARRLGLAGAAAAAALLTGWAMAGPAYAADAPSAVVEREILTITGTGDAERIALRLQAGAPNILEVDFADDGTAEFQIDRATFNRAVVLALGGDDEVRVDQVNGAFADEGLVIDGGRGDDSLLGGDGVEIFAGRGGDDTVDGNRGDDAADLGSGDDSFRWDPGDGSDRVEGERGTDTLDFNGAGAAENMSLSPNGERSLFLRDVANIRMDMGTVERLDLTALGGVDTFTLNNMSGTDFKEAVVDLSGPAGGPDGLADAVTVNGTARGDEIQVTTDGSRVDVSGLKTELRILGTEVADRLQVNGLDGDDAIDVDDAVSQLITPVIDPGAGQR